MDSITLSRRSPTSNHTQISSSSCTKLPKRNIKFNKSMKTMTTLLTKSNTSLTIINNMDVIIPDPNTMKSNATTSSSSPCPSSMEATIPKNTFHGH